jgi:transcription initiation factor TFIIIB Brf1 subunit/transcription initiation factor TFIIB
MSINKPIQTKKAMNVNPPLVSERRVTPLVSETSSTVESSDFDIYDMMFDKYSESQTSVNDCESQTGKICSHKDVINNEGIDICRSCGIELQKTTSHDKEWRYYGNSDGRHLNDPNRVQQRMENDKTIFKDIEPMEFDKRIAESANDLYIDITKGKIFRGRSRKAMIFACVFHAFKKLMQPQSHETLCQKFGITKRTGLRGLKFVNLNASKTSGVHTSHITTSSIISDIMSNIGSTDSQKNEVINLYNLIKNRSSKLNRSRPQSVACGLIYYWLKKEDINITLREFSNKTDLSELTIQKITSEINTIITNSIETETSLV